MDEIYNIRNGAASGEPEWWEIGFTLITTLIAIVSLYKAFQEYQRQGREHERQGREQERQGREKRAQQFLDLRKSYRENTSIQKILHHLYTDQDFEDISLRDRVEFMGFFEDLAFLVNSGLIRKELAFYMFIGDAIVAWKNDSFWSKELKDDKNWSLLADFVQQGEQFKAGPIIEEIKCVVI